MSILIELSFLSCLVLLNWFLHMYERPHFFRFILYDSSSLSCFPVVICSQYIICVKTSLSVVYPVLKSILPFECLCLVS